MPSSTLTEVQEKIQIVKLMFWQKLKQRLLKIKYFNFCKTCQYFSRNNKLRCAVHPLGLKEKRCDDWHFYRLASSPEELITLFETAPPGREWDTLTENFKYLDLELFLSRKPDLLDELCKIHYLFFVIEKPVDIIEKWVIQNPTSSICKWIARNRNTSEDCLLKLVEKGDEKVRLAIANNHGISWSILEKLIKDPSVSVKLDAIANPNVDRDFLQVLANSTDPEVRMAVARNSALSLDLLKKLSFDLDAGVRYWIVHNDNTTRKILFYLANDRDRHVRKAVILNKKFFWLAVYKYLLDRDRQVRKAAMERLDLDNPISLLLFSFGLFTFLFGLIKMLWLIVFPI